MNNVMREEFELPWQIKGRDDEGNLGAKPTRSKTDDDKYAGEAAQFAWMWWKRSRESIIVQLPENCKGSALTVSELKEQLDKEGIKYDF